MACIDIHFQDETLFQKFLRALRQQAKDLGLDAKAIQSGSWRKDYPMKDPLPAVRIMTNKGLSLIRQILSSLGIPNGWCKVWQSFEDTLESEKSHFSPTPVNP